MEQNLSLTIVIFPLMPFEYWSVCYVNEIIDTRIAQAKFWAIDEPIEYQYQ